MPAKRKKFAHPRKFLSAKVWTFKVINPELASISNVLSDKRKMYFKMLLSGHKLENIRLNPFLITEGLEDFSDEESC